MRRRRRFRRPRVPRSVVPYARLVKLRATEHLTLTGTTGAIATHNIYWNSLQDPFVSDSTNQPLYYDQIKTMYRTAIVLGAKITVQFHNNSSTVPLVAGLYCVPWDNSQSLTNYEYYREASWTGRQRILTSDIDIVTLTQKISGKKFFHQSMKNESDFRADIENDGDPSKLGAAAYFIQALDQAATATCFVVVTLEQVVKLQDPYTPSRSVDA